MQHAQISLQSVGQVRLTNIGKRFLAVAIAVTVAMPLQLQAQKVTASAPEPFRSCAETDAFKAFELEQYNQYVSSSKYQRLLVDLRKKDELLKSLIAVEEQLNARPDKLNDTKTDKKFDVQKLLARALQGQKLPTCYENPLTYYMLSAYAKDIDKARRSLKLDIPKPLTIATLPSDDINAYTYPVLDGSESVVAVNTQLFMFVYQMAKVTMPTVTTHREGDKISVDVSFDQPSPKIATNFAMAILEFLSLVDPSTEPLDSSFDGVLMRLVAPTEKFVIGHEYGHVISGHSFRVGRFRLGAAGDPARTTAELPVLVRSWQQELEADELGFKLLRASLRDTSKNGRLPEDYFYSLRGALFFFRCLSIIEEARALRDNGQIPPVPTLSEREFVRSYVAGTTTAEQNASYSALLSRDHPPTWLRTERMETLFATELEGQTLSEDARGFLQMAKALERNAGMVWSYVQPRMPILLQAIQSGNLAGGALTAAELGAKADDSPAQTCGVPEKYWPSPSLCTEELIAAIDSFSSGSASDNDILALYEKALGRDWRLFSGAQADWANMEVSRNTNVRLSLALLALTGNLDYLQALEALDASTWSNEDKALLARTREFLRAHGRTTTLEEVANLDPTSFRREAMLAFPSSVDGQSIALRGIPERSTSLDRFFASHGGMKKGGSVSAIMTSSMYLRHTDAIALSLIADFLIQTKQYQPALAYAKAGKAKGGLSSVLDNTIGNALSAQGNYREAINYYEASLRAGRVDGWPEINMAMNYARLSDGVAAEKWYRAGLKRKPTVRMPAEYARYLNEFAWFLIRKKDRSKAVIDEALRYSAESNAIMQFSDADYLDTLAECLHQSGNKAAAVKAAEAVVVLSAGDPDTLDSAKRRLEEFKARASGLQTAKRRQ